MLIFFYQRHQTAFCLAFFIKLYNFLINLNFLVLLRLNSLIFALELCPLLVHAVHEIVSSVQTLVFESS